MTPNITDKPSTGNLSLNNKIVIYNNIACIFMNNKNASKSKRYLI